MSDLPDPVTTLSGRAGEVPERLIGDVVVDFGFAAREAVEEAVGLARAQGKPTGQTLVEQGALRHDQLARAVAERYGIDYVDLALYDVDMGAVGLLDMDAIRGYQAVPVSILDDGALLIVTADPMNALMLDDISMITGRHVKPACASADEIRILIMRLDNAVPGADDPSQATDRGTPETRLELFAQEQAGEQGELAVIRAMLAHALRRGSSGIHISLQSEGTDDTQIMLRIDGELSPGATLEYEAAQSALARLKNLAGIGGSASHGPREGHFTLSVDERQLHVRVLTLPLIDGEDAFLRITDRSKAPRSIDELGMLRTEQDRFAYAISRPSGMVIFAGPTHSGTTTTLYAALAAINDGSRSIITIEDHVELELPGARQMQLPTDEDVTFASGLRSVMHADPDVIMISQIGELQSAHAAVQAAIAGRMTLCAMHAPDAPSALTRLVEMGIEPHLVCAAVDCVIAQRLVRMLCPHCKRPSRAPASLLTEYGLHGSEALDAVGCPHCSGSGYRGRIGVFEVMPVTEEIRRLVLDRAPAEALAGAAMPHGMRRLGEDAIAKVRAGLTSISEMERMLATLS